MDTLRFNCVTPELRRLVTFQETPFPNGRKMSISNSPAKFAQAGFLRRSDAKHDEVSCEHCDITYSNWEGESPFAVHRTVNEHCPFLSTPSLQNAVEDHPTLLEARRRWRLFPADAGTDDSTLGDLRNDSGYDSRLEDSTLSSAPPFVSLLSPETSFTFPFRPKVGDYSMLFVSRRLKTFRDPGCSSCAKWAEEGFVYRPDTEDVLCVFCAVVLPFEPFRMQQKHADNSPLCPRVLKKDVGNITLADEKRIRPKYLRQQVQRVRSQSSFTICHPQYEDEDTRAGTFENWPQLAANLDPVALTQAGFYFTGCTDKVKCYCCGLGLYKWHQGSDPWEQHALHMPTCPHLQAKGEHFIQQAAQAQVLTATDGSPSTNLKASTSDAGQVLTLPVGSLTMDMSAVTAALTTSQYSISDIRQAVLTYFFHTSRFPTQDILLGQLRAADLNFADLCRQREAVHQRDTELQQTHTQLQQTHTQLQQRDTQLQQRDTQLQQTHTQLQQTHTQLQQRDTQLQQREQQHVQALHQRDEELQVHRDVLRTQEDEIQRKEVELQRKEAEIQQRQRQIAYQEQQISSLQHQVQSLLADRRQQMAQQQQQQQQQQVQQAAPNQAAAAAAAVAPPAPPNNNTTTMTCDIRCKVCLSAESNTIFQPCHHITCCKTCAQRLISEVCPVCRTPISKVLPAYIT